MNTSPTGGTARRLIVSAWTLICISSVQAEVSVEEIEKNPDLWPSQITIVEDISYGNGLDFPAGTVVDVWMIENGEVAFGQGTDLFRLEPEFTDLLDRADQIAAGEPQSDSGLPRLVDYLVRNGKRVTETGFESVDRDSIPDGNLFLVYYGASTCGYCRSSHPFIDQLLAMINERHPGTFQMVHASGDMSPAAAKRYARELGAGWIVTEPMDRLLIENFISQKGQDMSVTFPTLIIFNQSARMVTFGSRKDSDLTPVAKVLEDLDKMLVAQTTDSETLASLD